MAEIFQSWKSDDGSLHDHQDKAVVADLCHAVKRFGDICSMALDLDPSVAQAMVQEPDKFIGILRQVSDRKWMAH